MAWLLDEDDEPDIEIVDSSPVLSKRSRKSRSPALSDDSVCVVVEAMSSKSSGKRRATTPIDFGLDDSVELVEQATNDADESVELVAEAPPRIVRPTGFRRPEMPPPELPSRVLISRSPPQPTFPVRAPGRVSRPSRLLAAPESPGMDMPPPSQRRLHRRESPTREDRPRQKSHKTSAGLKEIYDTEAVHSGDEVSEGSSGSDVESESDRQFLQGLPETQMSPSYDQSLAYRQSLLTQAPGGGQIPSFANRPARRAMFGGGRSESSRRRPQVSSSPPPVPDDTMDAYDFGSFVVDDDDDISFLSSET